MEAIEREMCKEKKRETCNGERKSQMYNFFLGLEINVECIK